MLHKPASSVFEDLTAVIIVNKHPPVCCRTQEVQSHSGTLGDAYQGTWLSSSMNAIIFTPEGLQKHEGRHAVFD